MSLRRQLEQKFGRVREHRGKNGLEFRICCPMCIKRKGKVDRKFKLHVNPQRGFNCYRCDFRGKNISFLLGTKVNLSAEDMKPAPPRKLEEKTPYDTLEPLEYMPDSNCAIQYLLNRGFDPWVVSRMLKLQYVRKSRPLSRPEDGLFFNATNTIMFPVHHQGMLVGWQYRLLYDPGKLSDEQCAGLGFPVYEGKIIRPPKYFTGGGLPKSRVLYNGDQAALYSLAVAVEGGLDVAGVGPNSVGLYGKSLSDDQLALLEQWPIVAVMLDPEASEESEATFRRLSLSRINPTIRVVPPNNKDPGSNKTADNWRAIMTELTKRGINPRKLVLPTFKEGIPRP